MDTFGAVREGVPSLPKCRVQVWKSYRTYQSVGYGYGCCAKLTKVSGMVWMLVPVPVPDPLYFNKAVSAIRIFCRGRTELTKVSGTGMDVVPNLPKNRVRVWMLYQTDQSVGHRYRCRTKLTKGSGTGIDVLPTLPKSRVWCGSRTKLIKVLVTGNTRGSYSWFTLVGTLPYTP